ncbi:MAG TPA: amino acid adenylation domain-containing protein, partial [Polyangiaceae bacterium]|nr:amino acid adenylation domain-containing protein [Polyangiaceae bacterium]
MLLSVDDLGEEFVLTAQVSRPVEPERVCGYMESALAGLVELLEANEGGLLEQVEVLPAAEREQVVQGWNQTAVEYPRDLCVHELFEAQVEASPNAVAVRSEVEELSYRELNERANQLAHLLRERGVGPDARVALGVERSVELVVMVLATLKAGGAYVPLDAEYPAERLERLLKDSEPVLTLTRGSWAEPIAQACERLGVLHLDLERDREQWSRQSHANPRSRDVGLESRHLAYVIYTSGSTGEPKGAMNEHRGITNRLLWMKREFLLGEQEVFLQKTPLTFDISVWEVMCPLLSGGKLVMARPGGHKDAEYLQEVIEREQVTLVHFVPSMLQVFLEQAEPERCRSVRRVVCSGEALLAPLVRKFHDRFGAGVELYNLYGPTEAAVEVSVWRSEPEEERASIPIGRPIDNARLYVLDERRQPLPVGVAGELYIGGVPVCRGYLKRPELSAERFVSDPFHADERMYRTGDQGRWLPDGTVEYLGRNDQQVKVRGYRIELGEIESQLSSQPGVGNVVVVAREDQPGHQRLVAYYTVSNEGAEPEATELRAGLLRVLPEYMVPVAYVKLAEWPLLSSGKVDRKALPLPEQG